MQIRHASLSDLDQIAALEAACFPAAEAAGRESLKSRLSVFPDRFWLAEENGRIIAMVNGMLTDMDTLTDEMYGDSGMHDPHGCWQMIFGVDTDPAFRGRGIASRLMRQMIDDCRAEKRLGAVLTCKERLIPFYQQLGFVSGGISRSVHGGAVWYDMRLRL